MWWKIATQMWAFVHSSITQAKTLSLEQIKQIILFV
jgi:hypothetical protein